MDGFIALAVFAKQLSESQKKLSSTQRKQDWPSSDGDEVAPPTIQNSAMKRAGAGGLQKTCSAYCSLRED
jgi:hypothetical protein